MTTTPEQIEAVARIIAYETGYTWGSSALDHDALREAAIAVIAFMRPFIRAEALEEAAKMCEECPLYDEDGVDWNTDPQVTLAAAIRALKEKP
jgi:hypothetical protein